MGLVLPTRGAPGAGVWDDTIDANYGLEDAHDHSTGKGIRVPTAGININADLSFSSLYAPTALHRVTFAQIAALASNNQSIFVSDGTGGLTTGELYWRTNAGVNVKLTSGSALNVAAFVGGIGGDYTAASALLSYDSATLSYWLQQPGSPRPWARIRTGDVDIYQTAASIVNRVRLQSPAALAASYAITLPAALPGSTSVVQVDSGGVLTASTAASITLTGAAEIKHGDRTKNFHPATVASTNGANWNVGVGASSELFAISTASSILNMPLDFIVGDRIKSISFKVFGDGAVDLTTSVFYVTAAMSGSSIGGPTTTTNQPASWSTVTIDVTDTTLAALDTIYISFNANAASMRIGNISVTYDHP